MRKCISFGSSLFSSGLSVEQYTYSVPLKTWALASAV
jgi:hypothetical protein